ncbi:MAG TPA: type II toxin-antitoxin system HigB family toxin [Pyrinomonadaceae bacterium]|nr:type II toxin-antitoxin system HigB family toxin [Pyrinomonadaceae bacterium]
MRVISRRALRDYWESHPESEEVLVDWFRKMKRIDPKNLAELKQTFPSADLFGCCVVFNVGGNNYRVITHVNYRRNEVFIRFVLSHAEYNKDKWKTDC